MISEFHTMDDKALWIALTNGSEEALMVIRQRHVGNLCMRARHLLKDQHYAEDVMQELFTRLWANYRKLPKDVDVVAYLQKIVANICYDFHRSGKRQPVKYLQLNQLPVQA